MAPQAEERSPHDLWAQLEPADADALSARGIAREFRRGHALCHERQLPDRVLVIRSGRVKITVSSAAGREVVLAFRGPGELVGELSALDDEPRSATVVALEPVEALAIAHGDFRAYLADHPAASLALMRMLARRLRDADAKRLEFASASTLERVASRLLELCERFGETAGDYVEIDLPLSQEELAGWAGASLESVGRALQTMRGLGWIETRRRQVRVIDIDALRRAAA
jgi:CRP/FNR family transcriptional regulator, cyclic AMP receptor protein